MGCDNDAGFPNEPHDGTDCFMTSDNYWLCYCNDDNCNDCRNNGLCNYPVQLTDPPQVTADLTIPGVPGDPSIITTQPKLPDYNSSAIFNQLNLLSVFFLVIILKISVNFFFWNTSRSGRDSKGAESGLKIWSHLTALPSFPKISSWSPLQYNSSANFLNLRQNNSQLLLFCCLCWKGSTFVRTEMQLKIVYSKKMLSVLLPWASLFLVHKQRYFKTSVVRFQYDRDSGIGLHR